MLGNIFILGDSYSTFEGYIPQECIAYYTTQGPGYLRDGSGLQPCDDDVCDVTQTWWYSLAKENGNLLENCSFSGTTICNTGYNGVDASDISFIGRLNKLISEGYFKKNKVDTFFLFGGTNDSWAGSPIGVGMDSGWEADDLYNVLPAFGYIINRIINTLPDTKLYFILNTDLKDEIEKYYTQTCEKNGVDVIKLHDIEKISGHPTIKGMAQIKEQVMEFINSVTPNVR